MIIVYDSQGRPKTSATGESEFIELTDTPSSYTGEDGKVVAVKNTEDGLEFVVQSGAGVNDTLNIFHPYNNEPPSSNYATLDTRNQHPVLDFDDSTDEESIFTGILPRRYGGNGVTIVVHWAATTSVNTGHYCRWQAAFEALSGQDLDSDGFASAQSVGGNPNATCGIETVSSIVFTDGAQIDSLSAGEAFRLKVNRDADGTSGTDDLVGDTELLIVEIKETA
jgi:hypothetical protein